MMKMMKMKRVSELVGGLGVLFRRGRDVGMAGLLFPFFSILFLYSGM